MHSSLALSAILLVVTVSAAPSSPGKALESRDDANNIGILTSYFGYDGCSDDQKKQVQQAQKDAVMLATNAVKSPGINWGSDPAAIDFFGPADETESRGTRQHIIGKLLLIIPRVHGLCASCNVDKEESFSNTVS
jgi:hypothetical protein